MYLILNLCIKDTALEQVQVEKDNLVVLLGTNNMQLNCSITLNASIGPEIGALQISWLMNGTKLQSNTQLTPLEVHSNSFTSVSTVDITGYNNTGNYCCSASLAGSDSDMSDCIIVTVSGIFVTVRLFLTMYMHTLSEISISEDYSNLRVGSTQNVTCTVSGILPEAVMWNGTWRGTSAIDHNVLMLSSVDSTLDKIVFTCSVNSVNLYRPGEREITVTVKG